MKKILIDSYNDFVDVVGAARLNGFLFRGVADVKAYWPEPLRRTDEE